MSILKIYESTWPGVLQEKLISIESFSELLKWFKHLQHSDSNISDNLKQLLKELGLFAEQNDQFFPYAKTDAGKLLYAKEYFSNKIMEFVPMDTDEILRQKYILKFSEEIPNFEKDWSYDVNFREGDNSLLMLFVFLHCCFIDYDEKTLIKMFKIVDEALLDHNEIVQAEIARGFLLPIALEKPEFLKYMPENTVKFCKALQSFCFTS